jgi:AraC-like DNA-binding protein
MNSVSKVDRSTPAITVVGPTRTRMRGGRQSPLGSHHEFQGAAPAACCLARELLQRFLSRVPNAIVVRHPDELLELALAEKISLIVADPGVDEGRCMRMLLRLRETCPATLIVVYTSLRASVMSDIVELAQHGVRDVIIFGTDDSRSRFDELIERGATMPLTVAVLRLLDTNLRRLRPRLADAVIEMFATPRRLASVHQLAAAAGTTRRSLYRHLAAAGIKSPRLLVVAARIVRAAQMLAHSRVSIRDVARSLGFSKPDIMTLQFVSLIGLRPRQLRDPVMLAALPQLVISRLISGDPATCNRATGKHGSARDTMSQRQTRSAPRGQL